MGGVNASLAGRPTGLVWRRLPGLGHDAMVTMPGGLNALRCIQFLDGPAETGDGVLIGGNIHLDTQ